MWNFYIENHLSIRHILLILNFTTCFSFQIDSKDIIFNNWKCSICHHDSELCRLFNMSSRSTDYNGILLMFFNVCLFNIIYTNVLCSNSIFILLFQNMSLELTCCEALLSSFQHSFMNTTDLYLPPLFDLNYFIFLLVWVSIIVFQLRNTSKISDLLCIGYT